MQDNQPSPLALLAATCSKIGSTPEETAGTTTTHTTAVKLVGQNQLVAANGQIIATLPGQQQYQSVSALPVQIATALDGNTTQYTPVQTANIVTNVNGQQVLQPAQVVTNGLNLQQYNVLPQLQLDADGNIVATQIPATQIPASQQNQQQAQQIIQAAPVISSGNVVNLGGLAFQPGGQLIQQNGQIVQLAGSAGSQAVTFQLAPTAVVSMAGNSGDQTNPTQVYSLVPTAQPIQMVQQPAQQQATSGNDSGR